MAVHRIDNRREDVSSIVGAENDGSRWTLTVQHPAMLETAVIGVPDRVGETVVLHPGRRDRSEAVIAAQDLR